jgi:hypothetical protein
MNSFTTKLIWCLPVAGLLFTFSVLLRGQVYDVSDTANFLRFATSPSFQAGATWNVFNFILLFLGVIGIGLYAIEQTDKLTAKIAFILLFIAHCLTFCYLGLLAFLYQKAAELTSSNPDILSIFDLSKNTAIIPVVAVDTVTYLLGTILTTFVLIKHKLFPVWVSALFGISFFLVGIIPPAALTVNPDISRVSEIVGNICIFISGFFMVKTLRHVSNGNMQ